MTSCGPEQPRPVSSEEILELLQPGVFIVDATRREILIERDADDRARWHVETFTPGSQVSSLLILDHIGALVRFTGVCRERSYSPGDLQAGFSSEEGTAALSPIVAETDLSAGSSGRGSLPERHKGALLNALHSQLTRARRLV